MAMGIVPSDVFPADKAQPDSDKVIGSGRYTVESYEPSVQTVLEKNSGYTGVTRRRTSGRSSSTSTSPRP